MTYEDPVTQRELTLTERQEMAKENHVTRVRDATARREASRSGSSAFKGATELREADGGGTLRAMGKINHILEKELALLAGG